MAGAPAGVGAKKCEVVPALSFSLGALKVTAGRSERKDKSFVFAMYCALMRLAWFFSWNTLPERIDQLRALVFLEVPPAASAGTKVGVTPKGLERQPEGRERGHQAKDAEGAKSAETRHIIEQELARERCHDGRKPRKAVTKCDRYVAHAGRVGFRTVDERHSETAARGCLEHAHGRLDPTPSKPGLRAQGCAKCARRRERRAPEEHFLASEEVGQYLRRDAIRGHQRL